MRWLIHNNALCKHVHIDTQALNSLPENSIPDDLLSVESDEPVENVGEPEIFDNANELPISDDSHSDDDVVYNKD